MPLSPVTRPSNDSLSESSNKSVETVDQADLCYHCLEPIPKYCDISTQIEGVERPMCCIGCKAAADFINQRHLNRFYEHRDRTDAQDFFGSLNAQEAASSWQDQWMFIDASEDARRQDYVQLDAKGNRSISLIVHGLYCSSCAWLVEKAIHSISKDIRVHVEVDALRVNIQVADASVALSSIIQTIARLGYQPELVPSNAWFDLENTHKQERASALRRLVVAGFCMMQVMTYAVGFYMADASEQGMLPEYERFFLLISMLVATVAVFYSGKPFFTNALNDLSNGHFGMDVPVALAIGGAYFPSVYIVLTYSAVGSTSEVFFDSAVMFVFFLSIGRYVEMRARHRLADSSGEVNRMLPDTVTVDRAEHGESMQFSIVPKDVQLADQITLHAGDIVPFDAQIINGAGSFDESLLTGEAAAVQRDVGSQVYVGSRLVGGTAVISANKVWTESSLFKINQLVQSASAGSAGQGVSQIGRSFVVWVLVLTALVGSVWMAIEPDRVFHIVLAMLVASCPCAFSLAAPVGRTAAAHTLRRNGVLLADPDALQVAGSITHWLFDKTGTLTLGKPTIDHFATFTNIDQKTCLRLIADTQAYSDHALAKAFSGFRSELDSQSIVTQFVEVPGSGISAKCDGKPILIGRRDWVLAKLKPSSPALIETLDTKTKTYNLASEVLVAFDGVLVAAVYLSDSIRTSSASALARLAVRGGKVKVLSGDKYTAVKGVCEALGVESFSAELLPEDKLAALQELQSQAYRVAMVGDGVNDAPVLAAADLSIALATGSELSQYHADVILLNGDLEQLNSLLDVAQMTDRVVRQNLNWALAYNGIALPLAALGFLTPWLAALGMSLSSLLVVLNALRIRTSARVKK